MSKCGNCSIDWFSLSIEDCEPNVALFWISSSLRDKLSPHKAVRFEGSLFTAFSNDLIAVSLMPNVVAHSPHLTHVSVAVAS